MDCTQNETGWLTTRGLTRGEYANTVRDLLGVTTDVTAGFPEDEMNDGFTRGPLVVSPPQPHYLAAATAVAAAYDVQSFADECLVNGEAYCADTFAQSMGNSAARRPITVAEKQLLLGAYEVGIAGGTFEDGIRAIVEEALSWPSFIYRFEADIQGANPGDIVPVPPIELAVRMSYFIWGSMPDAELMMAAANGELGTADGVEAQARRMIDDPRASFGVRRFATEWLGVARDAANLNKDAAVFPAYTAALYADMQREVGRLAESIVLEGDQQLHTLLTTQTGFVNDALANVYGIPAVGSSDALVEVTLPAERAGVLTRLGFLTANANANSSGPVQRGVAVRELLCETLPAPPPDVNVDLPPPPDEPTTLREQLELFTEAPSCHACHSLVNEPGFAFERFDGIGALRNQDNGLPIDESGVLTQNDPGDFAFANGDELRAYLATSPDVMECVGRKWFRYGLDRSPDFSDSETCAAQAFVASGGDMVEAMVATTRSYAFRFRPALQPSNNW